MNPTPSPEPLLSLYTKAQTESSFTHLFSPNRDPKAQVSSKFTSPIILSPEILNFISSDTLGRLAKDLAAHKQWAGLAPLMEHLDLGLKNSNLNYGGTYSQHFITLTLGNSTGELFTSTLDQFLASNRVDPQESMRSPYHQNVSGCVVFTFMEHMANYLMYKKVDSHALANEHLTCIKQLLRHPVLFETAWFSTNNSHRLDGHHQLAPDWISTGYGAHKENIFNLLCLVNDPEVNTLFFSHPVISKEIADDVFLRGVGARTGNNSLLNAHTVFTSALWWQNAPQITEGIIESLAAYDAHNATKKLKAQSQELPYAPPKNPSLAWPLFQFLFFGAHPSSPTVVEDRSYLNSAQKSRAFEVLSPHFTDLFADRMEYSAQSTVFNTVQEVLRKARALPQSAQGWPLKETVDMVFDGLFGRPTRTSNTGYLFLDAFLHQDPLISESLKRAYAAKSARLEAQGAAPLPPIEDSVANSGISKKFLIQKIIEHPNALMRERLIQSLGGTPSLIEYQDERNGLDPSFLMRCSDEGVERFTWAYELLKKQGLHSAALCEKAWAAQNTDVRKKGDVLAYLVARAHTECIEFLYHNEPNLDLKSAKETAKKLSTNSHYASALAAVSAFEELALRTALEQKQKVSPPPAAEQLENLSAKRHRI